MCLLLVLIFPQYFCYFYIYIHIMFVQLVYYWCFYIFYFFKFVLPFLNIKVLNFCYLSNLIMAVIYLVLMFKSLNCIFITSFIIVYYVTRSWRQTLCVEPRSLHSRGASRGCANWAKHIMCLPLRVTYTVFSSSGN